MANEWDAIHAEISAVQPSDVIRIRDGNGIKRALVVGTRLGHFLVRKQRNGKKNDWQGEVKKAYFDNVLAPQLILHPREDAPQACCPRCHGVGIPCCEMRPKIKREGWICLDCGHCFDEDQGLIPIEPTDEKL